MATIDETAWDGPAVMSAGAQSDDPAAFYRAVCAGHRDGDPALQSTWALPHHDAPGDAPNADGVRNSLSRLPQTQGLTNHDAALAHLQGHMDDIHAAMGMRAEDTEPDDRHVIELEPDGISVRSLTKRELDVRIIPWDRPISHIDGMEVWTRGTFDGTDPAQVALVGLDHERILTADSYGRPKLTPRVTGKGLAYEDRADGAYMTFKVAGTSAGDEILALGHEGMLRGVSVEVKEVPGGSTFEKRDGRRTKVYRKATLTGVAPIAALAPAFREAAVLAVRSSDEGAVAMAENEAAPEQAAAPVVAPVFDTTPIINHMSGMMDKLEQRYEDRIHKLEEQNRSGFTIPATPEDEKRQTERGEWLEVVLKGLSGERVPDSQLRALDDIITSDNLGVVPPTYMTELIGVIDPRRPFLSSTRRLTTPASGMKITVPVITQRPTVGVQDPEKEEVSSQLTKIGTKDFNAISIAGAGDISIQVLKRSDRVFLDLWVELLAEAYAIESENQALRALFNTVGGGITAASPMDPEDLKLGDAFVASFDTYRQGPDTLWLSTEAVGAFMDAKQAVTNAPLYPGLIATAGSPGGVGGTISGLRVVHVPQLDAHGAFAVVGPSAGFAWAEDGTYTLQVDVPALAGRDVALIGILWPAPWYPGAFTVYNVAS